MDFIDEFLNKENLTVEDLEKLEIYTRELEKNLTEDEINNLLKSKNKKIREEKNMYINNWFQMSDKEKTKEAKRRVKKFKKMPDCKGLNLKDITIKLK